MSILKTLTINGTTYSVTPVVPASSITLLASAWVGDGESYSQVVAVPGATAYTKVDLLPSSEQLAEFHHKVLAFVAENNGGVVTVYAIGDKPTGDHTIQITKTEVQGTGKIRGNTVGTTMPRPDWNQTDPTKADYIKNKPDISGGGGSGGGTVSNAVLYTAQDLNDDQKEQARKNIGAIGNNLGGKALTDVGKLQLGLGMDTYVDMSTRTASDGESVWVLFQTLFGNKVILHNIGPGTDDTDAVNVAQLNAAVGAIDTALDRIIAIQDELIGDFAFHINGEIYTALVGMTWGEWCDSEYNTIGAYVDETTGIVMIEGNYVARSVTSEDIDQLSNTVIIDKCDYYTY